MTGRRERKKLLPPSRRGSVISIERKYECERQKESKDDGERKMDREERSRDP